MPAGIPGRRGQSGPRIVVYVVLILVALLFFVPFLWSVSTSFKTLPESVQGFELLPNDPTLKGYRDALSDFNFARYMANSAFLAVAVTRLDLPRLARRLRVRTAALPRPRACSSCSSSRR